MIEEGSNLTGTLSKGEGVNDQTTTSGKPLLRASGVSWRIGATPAVNQPPHAATSVNRTVH
jgi:hypothetical protein